MLSSGDPPKLWQKKYFWDTYRESFYDDEFKWSADSFKDLKEKLKDWVSFSKRKSRTVPISAETNIIFKDPFEGKVIVNFNVNLVKSGDELKIIPVSGMGWCLKTKFNVKTIKMEM